MKADIKGCLANINKSYRIFTWEGKPMSKDEVKAVLEYGLACGYECHDDIPGIETSKIIHQVRNKKIGR